MNGASVTLEEGSRGSFEVFVEGRLIHSKLATGRIPRAESIEESLRDF